MSASRIAIFALCAALVGASSAQAQINPFRRSLPFMQSSDFQMLSAAAHDVYAVPNPTVGASKTWNNAATGNSGTVRLVNVYQWKNLPCRHLEHVIQPKSQRDTVRVRVDRCRTAAGEWKTRFPD